MDPSEEVCPGGQEVQLVDPGEEEEVSAGHMLQMADEGSPAMVSVW